jgi:hypothetical protein
MTKIKAEKKRQQEAARVRSIQSDQIMMVNRMLASGTVKIEDGRVVRVEMHGVAAMSDGDPMEANERLKNYE